MQALLRKVLRVAAAATLLSGGAVALTAAPAQAAALNCPYPYACLYNLDNQLIHKYQVVTSGFQSTGGDIDLGVNSRNDDVVYIRYTTGSIKCMPAGKPNNIYDVGYYGIANGIRIDSASICAYQQIPLKSR